MSGTQLYLLILRLSPGNEPGVDVPVQITKVSTVLADYSKATKCLYKFKVTILSLWPIILILVMLNDLRCHAHF